MVHESKSSFFYLKEHMLGLEGKSMNFPYNKYNEGNKHQDT